MLLLFLVVLCLDVVCLLAVFDCRRLVFADCCVLLIVVRCALLVVGCLVVGCGCLWCVVCCVL